MSPKMAGVAVFPESFTVCPAAVVVGNIICRTGRYRWSLWSGWIIITIGMGLMYLLDVGTPTRQWVPINIVGGLGSVCFIHR
jgi:hypothetical protein